MENSGGGNQLTVPRVIELIGADLDVLREFWRIRKDQSGKKINGDLRQFIGKLDSLIEFWQRLQILNGDPIKIKAKKCVKCHVRKNSKDQKLENSTTEILTSSATTTTETVKNVKNPKCKKDNRGKSKNSKLPKDHQNFQSLEIVQSVQTTETEHFEHVQSNVQDAKMVENLLKHIEKRHKKKKSKPEQKQNEELSEPKKKKKKSKKRSKHENVEEEEATEEPLSKKQKLDSEQKKKKKKKKSKEKVAQMVAELTEQSKKAESRTQQVEENDFAEIFGYEIDPVAELPTEPIIEQTEQQNSNQKKTEKSRKKKSAAEKTTEPISSTTELTEQTETSTENTTEPISSNTELTENPEACDVINVQTTIQAIMGMISHVSANDQRTQQDQESNRTSTEVQLPMQENGNNSLSPEIQSMYSEVDFPQIQKKSQKSKNSPAKKSSPFLVLPGNDDSNEDSESVLETTEFQVKEEMVNGNSTEMVILYSDLLKVEIDEEDEQLPHSTTPINSPAKSQKKITETMKRFSPRVVLDKSLADRVYNLSSKGINVQFQHLQPIEETSADLEIVNCESSEIDDSALREKIEEELETQRKSLLERFYKKQEQKQKKKRKLDY